MGHGDKCRISTRRGSLALNNEFGFLAIESK